MWARTALVVSTPLMVIVPLALPLGRAIATRWMLLMLMPTLAQPLARASHRNPPLVSRHTLPGAAPMVGAPGPEYRPCAPCAVLCAFTFVCAPVGVSWPVCGEAA